jgi:hypothetical protein
VIADRVLADVERLGDGGYAAAAHQQGEPPTYT